MQGSLLVTGKRTRCPSKIHEKNYAYLGSYDKIDDAIKARQRGEEMHDDFLEWYYQQYGSVQKSE